MCLYLYIQMRKAINNVIIVFRNTMQIREINMEFNIFTQWWFWLICWGGLAIFDILIDIFITIFFDKNNIRLKDLIIISILAILFPLFILFLEMSPSITNKICDKMGLLCPVVKIQKVSGGHGLLGNIWFDFSHL